MKNCKLPVPVIPFIGLALISLIVYFCAPSRYVWEYDLYCGIQYICSLVVYFIMIKKKNYFDFDTIFLLSYFFVFFVYSIFLYPISETYFFVFAYSFNANVISESTALALLGSQMYLLGAAWFHFKKKDKYEHNFVKPTFIPTNVIHYITIILFLLFILAGGYTFLAGVYRDGESLDEVSVISYIYALFIALYMVSVTLEFNKLWVIDSKKLPLRQVNLLFVSFIVLSCAVFLSTGSRTAVLQMSLALIGLYSMLYRPIGIKQFLLLFIVGVSAMSFVVVARSGKGTFEVNSFVDLFMDLVVNNRNTFTAVEYAHNNGFSYGVSMLAYIFKVVPMMQGVACSAFGLDPNMLRSAMILTVDTLGANATWGLGTNIIADLYLAFGSVGVIVFMYYLGFLVHKSEYKAKQGNVYYLLLYGVFISLSVYMVRSEYFYGLSLFVWSLCVINVLRHFIKKREV